MPEEGWPIVSREEIEELAFRAFWVWTGYPTELMVRKAWVDNPEYCKELWRRVVTKVIEYRDLRADTPSVPGN